VAGGLDLVTFADVWVNSENVELQMALLRPPGPRAARPHRQHRLPQPDLGPGARVAVELSLEAARSLLAALEVTVERAAHH
jgi:hypothetical protein